MTQENIRACIQTLASKIPAEALPIIKLKLENADDRLAEILINYPYKSPMLILLLSIFFGGLGVDRFVLGDIGLGVCKLLFGWLTFYIWPFVDIFVCFRKAKTINLNNVMKILNEFNIK